jgi:hypothetical protein
VTRVEDVIGLLRDDLEEAADEEANELQDD